MRKKYREIDRIPELDDAARHVSADALQLAKKVIAEDKKEPGRGRAEAQGRESPDASAPRAKRAWSSFPSAAAPSG